MYNAGGAMPEIGEVVLRCAHAHRPSFRHYLEFPERHMSQSDGSTTSFRFIVLCEDCYAKHARGEQVGAKVRAYVG